MHCTGHVPVAVHLVVTPGWWSLLVSGHSWLVVTPGFSGHSCWLIVTPGCGHSWLVVTLVSGHWSANTSSINNYIITRHFKF